MSNQRVADITALATLGGVFPLQLLRLGFHLMQVIGENGGDQYRYVMPPICNVPAGPFTMGDGRQKNNKPCRVMLDTFQIGKYPLTVAEYDCALQVGAVQEPKTGSSPNHNNFTWQDQLRQMDHPIVNITWFQAVNYADWLAQVTEEAWRLPTEAEWEKAARGIDGHIFPGGNNIDNTQANTSGIGIKTRTAVGTSPQGASPYGAQDMAGNVWEWCSSLYRDYPYLSDDGREDMQNSIDYRVLRGGSWPPDFRLSSAAIRSHEDPSRGTGTIGARLVVSLSDS
jgi:formylglycine-generating enzyme required for sulfatase activity